jgi:hypothetical protein
MYIKLQRRKENVVYVNGDLVITAVNILKFSLTMEKTLLDKGILKKLKKKKKSLTFYTSVNKLKR